VLELLGERAVLFGVGVLDVGGSYNSLEELALQDDLHFVVDIFWRSLPLLHHLKTRLNFNLHPSMSS
jgi:hypothetical protein